MPITPLDVVGKQLENAAKTQVRAAQAGVRRETSIVRQANARLGRMLQEAQPGKEAPKAPRGARPRAGVYVQDRPAVTAPDGYVRRSPVQALRVPPDYRKKCIKRAVGAAVAALVVAGIAVLLIQYLF